MAFQINMTGVEEQGKKEFKPLPKGEYDLQIIGIEEKRTQANDPMISVKYNVISGEFKGRHLYENIVFNDAIMGRTKHFLHVIGQPYEGEIEVSPRNWQGEKLRAYIDQRESNGRIYPDVKSHDYYEQTEEEKIAESIPF